MEIITNPPALQNAFFNPTPENLPPAADFLYQTSGNRLKDVAIKEVIFSLLNKGEHLMERYVRASIQSCAAYLSFLAEHPNEHLTKNAQTAIADLAPLLRLNKQPVHMDFVLLSTNKTPSLVHYRQVQDLFYNNTLKPDTEDRYHLDHTVVFWLRTALEQRVKGILGIDTLETQNGHSLGLAGMLDIVAQLQLIQFDPRINWNDIKKVNKWLSHHLHRGLRPAPWVIHQAFEVLNVLLTPGQYKNEPQWSWYSSSTTSADKDALRAEILEIAGRNNRPRITWLKDHEVLFLKENE